MLLQILELLSYDLPRSELLGRSLLLLTKGLVLNLEEDTGLFPTC